jgi:hypothetical protein
MRDSVCYEEEREEAHFPQGASEEQLHHEGYGVPAWADADIGRGGCLRDRVQELVGQRAEGFQYGEPDPDRADGIVRLVVDEKREYEDRKIEMFSQRGLIIVGIGSIAAWFILGMFNGDFTIFLTDGIYFRFNLSFITGLFFVIACGCLGLFILSIFALGILPSMPGLGSDEMEEELIFTKNELIEMDRDEEPHWNETHRQNSSASWDGGYGRAVYEDFRGNLRDSLTEEFIYNNRTDRRRVANGKVSDRFDPTPDGKWKYKR